MLKSAAALLLAMLALPQARAASAGGAFAPCADAKTEPGLAGSLCATVSAPLSYQNPVAAGAATVQLFVRKIPAAGHSRGAVWLVAGGPGESGASLYPFIASLRRSFKDMDLLIPDHRGTGYSTRLCPDEEGVGGPGGMALSGAEWGTCFARLNGDPELARQFSITHAAHDLKGLIERYRGRQPVYLYGVSYGTQLVLRTLQLGQPKLAGVVLDSLVPRDNASDWDLSMRSHVVDQIGRKVLAQCDADPACRGKLGEPAEALYRRLLGLRAEQPERFGALPGKNPKQFFGNLLNVPQARARLPYLLRELEAGGNSELSAVLAQLQQLGASVGGYRQSPASVPLVQIISASESTLRPQITARQVAEEEGEMLFTSPLPGYLAAPFGLPVYQRDGYFGKEPDAMPPTLVLQGTLDPKTHFDGALNHIAALKPAGKIKLVAVPGAPHFILAFAPACFERSVQAFMAGRAAPACKGE